MKSALWRRPGKVGILPALTAIAHDLGAARPNDAQFVVTALFLGLGFGVAGPRVVTVALVRDQYEGRQMARLMSFAMAVFILVPAIAPAVGQGIRPSPPSSRCRWEGSWTKASMGPCTPKSPPSRSSRQGPSLQ